jgi:HTH-type transcriptional repressor of NAD biosynthesis genes
MRKGLVIGKFLPPHKGHKHLIDTALSQVDQLTILVCDKLGQPISGELRGEWLRTIHPEAEVIVIPDELPDDDSKAWADNTRRVLGYVPDVVFTSEDYGVPYSRFLGCEHVLVDRDRVAVPCSGTMIRERPLDHLEFLEPVVRAHFVKRVCLVGAESTGKTTLAERLAREFDTVWVPEYGRDYTWMKLDWGEDEWTTTDFDHIAAMQWEMEERAAGVANKILICDTDAFATGIWHERYMGFASEIVDSTGWQSKCDLYLVSDVAGAPFVQDGIRDGEQIRLWMHDRFVEELESRGWAYKVLSGGWEERFSQAKDAVQALLRDEAVEKQPG